MNPYEVLGVSPGADESQIRAAYLAAVKKYHPDRYKDNPLKDLAEEKLKQINMAYDALCSNVNPMPQDYNINNQNTNPNIKYSNSSGCCCGNGLCSELFCCLSCECCSCC